MVCIRLKVLKLCIEFTKRKKIIYCPTVAMGHCCYDNSYAFFFLKNIICMPKMEVLMTI